MKAYKDDYQMENARIFSTVGYDIMQLFDNLEGEDTILHHSYLTVAATNILLAVELALKTLAELTIPKFEPKDVNHSLEKCFERLPQRLKDDIIRDYNDRRSNLRKDDAFGLTNSKKLEAIEESWNSYPHDLYGILRAHENGFVNWRYNEINKPVLFFDYYALSILFQVLQIHTRFIRYNISDKEKRDKYLNN